jgi:hypothetical protein
VRFVLVLGWTEHCMRVRVNLSIVLEEGLLCAFY